MIEITCIECGHKFSKLTGDMDERTCNICFEKLDRDMQREVVANLNYRDNNNKKRTNKMETVNRVRKTHNYNMFGAIDGNRTINQTHVRALKKSINKEHVPTPIIVNSKYEIIDGQHRVEAIKQLGKPVYFVVIDDLAVNDVKRLNTIGRNWTVKDFMELYIKEGNQNYIVYRNFLDKYKFNHNETITLLGNKKTTGGTQCMMFRDGDFVVHDYNRAVRNVEKILMVKDYYDGYRRRSFVYALLDLFGNEKYDHDRFLKKLKYQSVKLQDQTTFKQYLQVIEEIYNYKTSEKNRVRFY